MGLSIGSADDGQWPADTGTVCPNRVRFDPVRSITQTGLAKTPYTGGSPHLIRRAAQALFSVQFGFPSSVNGDPFRLLIVNASNPPAPVHLSLQWLTTHAEAWRFAQAPLASACSFLLGGARWQLQPFIAADSARQTNYLYKDWASEDLPTPGDELDFAAVKTTARGPNSLH